MKQEQQKLQQTFDGGHICVCWDQTFLLRQQQHHKYPKLTDPLSCNIRDNFNKSLHMENRHSSNIYQVCKGHNYFVKKLCRAIALGQIVALVMVNK